MHDCKGVDKVGPGRHPGRLSREKQNKAGVPCLS